MGEMADSFLNDIKDAAKNENVTDQLVEYAEDEIAPYWRAIAPVGDPAKDPHSGFYRDSIEVQRRGGKVYVVATDPKAHIIEWGSEKTPEFGCRAKVEAHFGQPF